MSSGVNKMIFIKSQLSIFRTITLMLSLLLSTGSYAEERINRKPLEFKKITSLSSATGWMLSPSGQWESKKNIIPWPLEEKNSTLKNSPYYALGTDNFSEYIFYYTEYEAKPFIVFVKHYADGEYEYKNIKRGWRDGTHTQAYAIDIEELHKLKQLTDGKINKITINTFDYQYIGFYSKKDALSAIQKSIGPLNARKNKATLFFEITPNKEKNITQFNIYNEIYIGSIKLGTGTRNYSYINGEKIFGSDKLIEICYFETAYSEFEAFIAGATGLSQNVSNKL